MERPIDVAERALLLSQKLDNVIEEQLPPSIAGHVDDIVQGRYAKVLQQSPVFEKTHEDDRAKEDLATWIDMRLSELDLENEETRFAVLATGIACLNAFVQINWTGPRFELTLAALLTNEMEDQKNLTTKIHQQCRQHLSVDSEEVYHLTGELGLLLVARHILMFDRLRQRTVSAAFWAMRAVFIQQQLLDECAGTLQNLLFSLSEESANALGINGEHDHAKALRIRHHVELALIHSYYGNEKEAFENMKEGQAASGLEWELTGALGRRTKFQQFDVTQLVMLASSKDEDAAMENKNTEEEARRPEGVELNDDTLLDSIAFKKSAENDKTSHQRHGNLQVIDQCLLLAFCLNVKNTNPEHGLTNEEMVPYVTRVLENPNNWMVHTMGLLLRSRLESDKTRTVERSALQLQALVDQIKVEDSGVEERLAYFYDLLLPSRWEMERELARRFMSIGVMRSALEIFERLEMWEDVVSCYQLLQQDHKAKEVLLQLLEKEPDSPKLLCILGDIEKDPKLWEKAWEISGKRFARAMRSLGSHYYKQDEFALSIECYQKSLKINPLFSSSWYMLGCAAMRTEQWEVAINAFRRFTTYDEDQAEAWSNLASVYQQVGRYADAYLAAKEAVRFKFGNWRMWDNLLILSLRIGKLADAVYAMQRVVDIRWLKQQHKAAVDISALRQIVDCVMRDELDLHDQGAARLERHVQSLLENVILSRITDSPEIWYICAKFYLWQKRDADALDASVKAYRSVMHDPRIETELAVFEDVAQVATDTVDMYEVVGDREGKDGKPVCADWRYESSAILKSLMRQVRDVFDDTETFIRLKERLDELRQTT